MSELTNGKVVKRSYAGNSVDALLNERHSLRENRHARQAFLDYIGLGSGRNLDQLMQLYRENPDAPTQRMSTLRNWFISFDWLARAEYVVETRQTQELNDSAQREQRNLNSGLALPFERVERLNQLYSYLENYIQRAMPIMTQELDPGAQPARESALILRFINNAFSHLRGILDDVAQETGGRAVRLPAASRELSIVDGIDAPRTDFSLLSEDEKGKLWQLLRKATPGAVSADFPSLQVFPEIT